MIVSLGEPVRLRYMRDVLHSLYRAGFMNWVGIQDTVYYRPEPWIDAELNVRFDLVQLWDAILRRTYEAETR